MTGTINYTFPFTINSVQKGKAWAISPLQWVNPLRLRQNSPPFPRRHFQTNFLNENFWIQNIISLKCADVIIGSDNGLAPNWRQAINWTNDGVVYCRMYASLGLNELNMSTIGGHIVWAYNELMHLPLSKTLWYYERNNHHYVWRQIPMARHKRN